MSMLNQFRLLAEYNRLMNERLFSAAETLDAEVLEEDKGAFFVSIMGTLNHLAVGDIIWLKRFAAHPAGYQALLPMQDIRMPVVLDQILYTGLYDLWQARDRLDGVLLALCDEIQEQELDHPLVYRDMQGEWHQKPFSDLLLHLFLHQTHHRGQVTTLLSQEAVDYGETDLLEVIPDIPPTAD